MEDGPQAVAAQVQFCMPVDKQCERFSVGMEPVFANIAGGNMLLYCLLFPRSDQRYRAWRSLCH
jgi:hypothetical protein